MYVLKHPAPFPPTPIPFYGHKEGPRTDTLQTSTPREGHWLLIRLKESTQTRKAQKASFSEKKYEIQEVTVIRCAIVNGQTLDLQIHTY